MPKIRDLGISVIPLTMRPPEIGGGGADVAQYGEPNTARYYAAERPQCNLTVKDPCERTVKPCEHTLKDPCDDTKPPDPACTPTYWRCPANSQCENSRQSAAAAALSEDAVAQLKQQLRQQVGTELPN
jgi:hypothetical protein